jgi:hypothetical protein
VKRGGSLSFLVGTISNVLVMEIGWTDVGSRGYILVILIYILGYLVLGLWAKMLLMSVFYDIFDILGYLVLGLWAMMLLMRVLYDIFFYILGYLVLGLWAKMLLMSVLYDIFIF